MDLHKSLKISLIQFDTTVVEIAKNLEVTPATVYKSCQSDARISTINRIAKAIGITTSQFIALGEI